METSTQSKHTPGPWAVVIDKQGGDWKYNVRTSAPHNPAGGLGKHIASVNPLMQSRGENNAALIAAAPDLLAACERFIDELGDKFAHIDGECTCSAAGSDPDCRRHGAVDFMRAAISKARFG